MSRMKYICVNCGTKTATLSKDLRGCLVCWFKKHPELVEGTCETCDGTGQVDSGGQDGAGNWINRDCPDCRANEAQDDGDLCATHYQEAAHLAARLASQAPEAHRPSERCPRWSCYKEAYYLGGRLISCTDSECANYDKDFMDAIKPMETILDIPMADLKKLVRQYGPGTIADATRRKPTPSKEPTEAEAAAYHEKMCGPSPQAIDLLHDTVEAHRRWDRAECYAPGSSMAVEERGRMTDKYAELVAMIRNKDEKK